MAELANGSPMPVPNGQGKNQRTPSAVQGQHKRNYRNNQNPALPANYADGTVSDSIAASPRPKKQHNKQRQQSMAVNGTHYPNAHPHLNGHKTRPVSLGGPMLPATPLKEQAYAGPTFQASPAPSSLPVPKFFSRSLPNGAAKPSLQARMEGEKTPEKDESSPEPDVVVTVDREAQQSPLDMFFQADREEKGNSNSGLLSPERSARRPPATEPRNSFQHSGKNIFLQEMDGDMPSPSTVPPQHRPVPERAISSPGAPLSTEQQQREASTRSLKDVLFISIGSPPPPPSNATPPHTQSRSQSDAQIFTTPSPFHRSNSGPSTPAPSTDQPNHYALHYGNRNLSPLFKAARGETPPRPSGLRQEVQNGHCDTAQQLPRQPPRIDPNSFSRDYLKRQIQNHPSGSLPQLPFMNGNGVNGNTNLPASFSGPSPAFQQGAQVVTNGASPRTITGGSRDISSMEDDLRRMLKLNGLS